MLGDDLHAALGASVPADHSRQTLADDYIPRLATSSSEVLDVGLARLTKPVVMRRDAEAFEQAFQDGRAAIHRRGLHDLGDEPARPCACRVNDPEPLREVFTAPPGQAGSKSSTATEAVISASMSAR